MAVLQYKDPTTGQLKDLPLSVSAGVQDVEGEGQYAREKGKWVKVEVPKGGDEVTINPVTPTPQDGLPKININTSKSPKYAAYTKEEANVTFAKKDEVEGFLAESKADEKYSKIIKEGAGTSSEPLLPNDFKDYGKTDNLSITLGDKIPNVFSEYMFQFTANSVSTRLAITSTPPIKWDGGNELKFEANKTYLVSIVNGIGLISQGV